MVHTYCLLRCDFTLALACGYLILFQVSIRCNHGNRVRLTNHVDGTQWVDNSIITSRSRSLCKYVT